MKVINKEATKEPESRSGKELWSRDSEGLDFSLIFSSN
jgi:hypothetical protein